MVQMRRWRHEEVWQALEQSHTHSQPVRLHRGGGPDGLVPESAPSGRVASPGGGFIVSSWLAPAPPPRGRHLLQCRGQPQPLSHLFAPKYLFCSQLWGHSQGEGGEFLGSRTDSPMGGRGWLSAPRPSKLGTCLKLGPERGLFLKQKRGQEDISETPAGRPQERWSGMVGTHPWSLVILRLPLSRAQRPGQPDGWGRRREAA